MSQRSCTVIHILHCCTGTLLYMHCNITQATQLSLCLLGYTVVLQPVSSSVLHVHMQGKFTLLGTCNVLYVMHVVLYITFQNQREHTSIIFFQFLKRTDYHCMHSICEWYKTEHEKLIITIIIIIMSLYACMGIYL